MFSIDRRFLVNFDWVLLILLVMVCGMALVNLYSATFSLHIGIPLYIKQCYLLLMGGMGIVFVVSFDYKELQLWNYLIYMATIALLALVIFVGDSAKGAQRWINLGFFQLQPSELAKLMIIISLASYYARKEVVDGYRIKDLIVPIILMAIPFTLILIQPDLGTALMLVIIFISMTVFARLHWSSYLVLGVSGMIMVALGWMFVLKPYQKQRVETLLNPAQDASGSGYQILQSKIAVGSGGWFGRGYMEGTQGHLHFLPERHTDFAFAVWSEEWGFSGCLFFLAVYFFMLAWGLHVAMSARDRFGLFLAFGVVALIFWQAVINLLMILGFLPVVGVPLPLFSYGGSSLLTTLLGIGIMMNVRMRRFQSESTLKDSDG
jgi:rod shape determining protein RodA